PDFAPGAVLAVDFGTPAAERVQVLSASPAGVALTAPLRFAHAAGATLTRVDSVRAGAPLAPYYGGRAAGVPGEALSPTLSWGDRSPAAMYTVEVATDSLFAAVVETRTGIIAPRVTVGPLATGVTHYWRVRGESLAGAGDWSARYTLRPGASVADAVARPVPLAPGERRGTWTLAATAEAAEVVPSCGAGANSVWFSFTAPADGRYAVETIGSRFDTVLSVWERSSHPLTELACNDDTYDDEGDDVAQSRAEFAAVAGRTYRVRVAGRAGAPVPDGVAVVRVRSVERPVNDDIAEAFPLATTPEPFWWSGDLSNAGLEDAEAYVPGCGPATNSLWWRYTPATDGTLLVSTNPQGGSEVIAGIGLWRADAAYEFPYEQIACATGQPGDDDDGDGEPDNGSNGTDVTLGVPVQAGQTYFVRLTGESGPFGNSTAAALQAQGPASIPAHVEVAGRPGWRMLSAPAPGYTVADMAALNLVQGLPDFYPGAGTNFYTGFDGTGYTRPAGGSDPLVPGAGFFWQLYDRGIQPGGPSQSVGLPFHLPVPTGPLPAVAEVPLHASGTGWNLVGNPFPVPLDAGDLGLWGVGGQLASWVGQTWDPNAGGTGSYRLAELIPGGLTPWSGMFVENRTDAQAATALRIVAPSGAPRPAAGTARQTLAFELHGTTPAGTLLLDPAAALVVTDEAATEWDGLDALKLEPIADAYVALAFDGVRADSAVWKAQESRPATAAFDVPIGVHAVGADGAFRLTWPTNSFAEGWRFTLTDTETGEAVDLRSRSEVAFTLAAGKTTGDGLADGRPSPRTGTPTARPLAHVAARGGVPRFVLHAEPPPAVGTEGNAPARFALAPVAPNPSRGRATVTVETPATAHVRVIVYDVLGRDVAVLADGEMAAGRHALALDASGLASGVYVVRMTSGDFAATRRLTVVR
ncbi:MAG TPA: T9SS type A sorting domain-containing protein, partial [Rubricoccaceae bacterium]